MSKPRASRAKVVPSKEEQLKEMKQQVAANEKEICELKEDMNKINPLGLKHVHDLLRNACDEVVAENEQILEMIKEIEKA